MSVPTVTINGQPLTSWSTFEQPQVTVKDAKAALKQTRKRAKAQRAAQKSYAKAEAKCAKNGNAAIKALREVANDDRKYSADARVEAARTLLENS